MKKTEKKELRWVYGTRHNKWLLVDDTDRDFCYGIKQDEMRKLGRKAAKIKYLSPSMV